MDDIIHPNAVITGKALEPWWHEFNPWQDRLLYVPVHELAECVLGIGEDIDTGERVPVLYTPELVLRMWHSNGHRLDGYILTSGPVLTAGVRYGPDPGDYLSPGFSTPKLVQLLRKWTPSKKRRA